MTLPFHQIMILEYKTLIGEVRSNTIKKTLKRKRALPDRTKNYYHSLM